MQIIFEAETEQGDSQELVLDRDISMAPSGTGDGMTGSVLEVANALLEDSLDELQANGLDLPDDQRSHMALKLAMAVLNDADEVQLPAVCQRPDGPRDPEESSRPDQEDEVEHPSDEDSDEGGGQA